MKAFRRDGGGAVGAAARTSWRSREELGIHRRLLYHWRDQSEPFEDGQGPPENSREPELREEVSALKRVLAEKTLELDFFKGALQKIEARRQNNATLARRHLRPNPRSDADARQPGYRAHVSAGAESAAPASIARCKSGRRWKRTWRCVRRFSRSLVEHRRRYGYRRITAELRRRGMLVNHKRVAADHARG